MTAVGGKRGPDLVLYLPRLPMGGVERGTVLLANHWIRQGRAVTLLLDRAEGPLMAAIDPAVPVTLLGVRRTARALPALLGFLRRTRPRLLHSALPWNSLMALAAGRIAGIPVSIAEHSLPLHQGSTHPRLLLALQRRAYPFAHRIIAPSADIADELATALGMPRAQIRVVGNPVVPGEVPAWRPTGDRPCYLALGRLVPVKDFPTLLRAFRLVLDHGPARLILLGVGPQRDALLALAAELQLGEAFNLPGIVADPWPLFAAADRVVISAQAEGFGNTVIEALACGTPVVSTRCGAPETLLHQGALGRLVPVGNPAALAAALLAPPVGTAEERRAGATAFRVPAAADRIWSALDLP